MLSKKTFVIVQKNFLSLSKKEFYYCKIFLEIEIFVHPPKFFVIVKIFYAIVKLLVSSCSSFLRDYEDFMIWFFFVDKKKKQLQKK